MAQITDQQRADFYRKQEESVGQQLFQQMVQTTKNRCFKTCVTCPGAALSKDEQKCLINCVDRFFEARAIVMHSYNKVYQSVRSPFNLDSWAIQRFCNRFVLFIFTRLIILSCSSFVQMMQQEGGSEEF